MASETARKQIGFWNDNRNAPQPPLHVRLVRNCPKPVVRSKIHGASALTSIISSIIYKDKFYPNVPDYISCEWLARLYWFHFGS